MDVLTVIRKCFAVTGPLPYAGEAVTQAEHALQCAQAAQAFGSSDALITAALLHDIGHMLDKDDERLALDGIDARHERQGAEFLETSFPPAVTEPVRLHVAAKAYLCAIDPEYHDRLSAVSRRSLMLQGGAMTTADVNEFRQLPYAADAVLLRRWDDQAKEVGRETQSLEHFLAIVAKTTAITNQP
ncbi:phosphonate degradation HD-domain oxygenase [Pseudomonas sp. MWU16-30317]|uniref:phosphonate degradation HD-domain oxygenase n=1 Tax=Pseudomonas sp. MWU16-30317 TaxID=2878095 RepID=UPI001CFC1822